MVPRPRWEATLQEEEFVHQGKKLERLKTLIGNHVASAGVKALKKINARHMLGLDSRVPLSFGYEVIAEFDDRESSTNAEKKRISVVPPINDNGMLYVGIENHLLLESYGGSVYEVKPPDAYEDEEGLEVVGLGRFSTLSQDVEEEKEGDPLLSLLYPSSEKTIVTYFRPLDEPVTIDTDDDLD